MKKSYTKNFIKIYFWKGLSIILNMLSMFIVVPELTSQPVVYGIYMLCISLNIFLSYADIGFVSAGYKYAAEYFGRGDLENEMRMQGFVNFILTAFLFLPFLFFLVLSIKPDLLISDLSNYEEKHIASSLLLIQAVFSFSIVLKRFNTIAYGIRLEDHKVNQISIIATIIKILSIFYFFRKDHYDIVGYFLFGRITELIGLLIITYLTKKRFNYSFNFLLRSFKFSKSVFKRTSRLAFASFYGTIMWILYQELDAVVITKLLGAEMFAFFAIGLTFTKFLRSLFSIIFSPFIARFNHLIGLKRIPELKDYYLKTLTIFFPTIFFFIFTLIMFRQPLIQTWVGDQYTYSISIVLFLFAAMIFNPLKNLSSSLIAALEKIKYIYLINTILALTYWLIILLLFNMLSLLTFAVSKLISFMIANILYLVFSARILDINLLSIWNKLLKPIFIPGVIIFLIAYNTEALLPEEKGKFNFLVVLIYSGFVLGISLALHYLQSKEFRDVVIHTYRHLKVKI